jgi:RNA polymerase sigma-70 factor (ECF subfamily)
MESGSKRPTTSSARADADIIAESLRTPPVFGAIFDRHFDAIHAYLQRKVGPERAEELASQTFFIAFDTRRRFESTHASARPWLFGIALNLARRHYRDMRRQFRAYARTGVDPLLSEFDAFEGIDVRLDALNMRPELAGALASLPKEELETLLLYAWAELSYAEIAEALAVPVGTVRSRMSRARARIKEPLAAVGAIGSTSQTSAGPEDPGE